MDNKVVIELDLDSKDFETKIGGAGKVSEKFFSGFTEAAKGTGLSFSGLASGIIVVNQALELAGKAVTFFKSQVEEAIKIAKIKNYEIAFESMAESIGVNADTIVNAVEVASNRSISRMEAIRGSMLALRQGIDAAAIPRLMALADTLEEVDIHGRKASEIFEDLVRAISTGMYRSVGDLGLRIKTTGDKQQDLNLLLEKGEKLVESYSGKLVKLGDHYSTLSNVIGEMYRNTKKNLVPVFDEIVKKLTGVAVSAGSALGLLDTERPANKVLLLEQRISSLKSEIEKLKTATPTFHIGGDAAAFSAIQAHLASISSRNTEIAQKTQELKKLEEELANTRKETEKQTQSLKNVEIDRSISTHRMNILTLEAQKIAARSAIFDEEQSWKAFFDAKTAMVNAEYQNRLNILMQQQLSEREFANQVLAIEMQKQQQLEAIREQALRNEQARQVRAATSLVNFSNEYRKHMSKTSYLSAIVIQNTWNGFTGFFEALGAGAENAADQVKGALFNMLGEIAINYGKVMLGAGLFPPNPLVLAAGASLVALGYFIKGLARRGGGGAAVGGGTAVSGGVSAAAPPMAAIERPTLEPEKQAEKTKTAQIIIQGHYFETHETATRLQQIIREASDVTDFKIQYIGAR